jgi:molybdate transport system substrate-binding protein
MQWRIQRFTVTPSKTCVNMAKPRWASDWTVGIRVAIERDAQAVLGHVRADLMAAIDREHSITAAAKAAGMSYRRAWTMIQEMNAAAGVPMIEAAVGGVKGGGARLTSQGRFVLEVYRQLHENLHTSAAGVLQQIISPDEKSSACVHLAAAISLQEAMGQLLAEYALRRPAVRVRAVYGASNELADHLLAGAPGDLFITAEESELNRLQAAGKLVPRSRRVVALNDLAVIGPRGSSTVKKLTDLLGKKIKQVVLAEPACPLGRYSQAFLKTAGIYDSLLPKVVHVDNSRAVLSAVASGTADAALAFSSDADRAEQCQTYFRIPHEQAAAKYVAGIVRCGKKSDDARLLLDFITSAAANCFRRCGLRPVEKL